MWKLSRLSLLGFLCICLTAKAQKPTLASVDKNNGGLNEVVTLKGSDFGTDPSKLKIFFGAGSGEIKSVSNQLIEVHIPAATTYDNIAVTNVTNGLTGYYPSQFGLKFNGDHGLSAASFEAETDFNAESGLYDLCFCDFNNDNKADIATASDNSNSLSIFQNGSSVGAINLIRSNILINAKSLHVTCGDLNGDGRPDLVVTEGADGDRVFVFRNTGPFTFSIQSIRLTGRKVKRVAIADLDLNGKPELVVTDKGSNIISILQNNSTISAVSFAAPVNITITGAISTDALEIKDINGNGLPEIITSQFLTASSNIFICDNKSSPGNFNFSDITTIPITNTIVNVRVGDIDDDGKPDIAATRLLGSDISVFLNQSSPSQILFSSPTSVLTATRPWGIDFGDVDGDGKLDVVIGSISNKSLTVLNNKSTPGSVSFETMLNINTNFINRHAKIGDLDGDGKPDIAFTSIDDNNLNVPSSRISIFRNKSCFIPAVVPTGPLSICNGFPLQLSTTTGGGVVYDWKKDGASVYTGPNDFLDITTSGAYSVTANSESGTCAKISNTVNVTVSTPGAGLNGTAPDARSNSPVCTDDVLNLVVNDVGATAYRWIGPGGFTSNLRTPVIPSFTIDKAGLYIVEMIIGSCVAKTDSTLVEGISNPDFSITFSGSELVCQGSTKILSTSPVMTSGFTYQWFEKTLGALSGQTNSTLSAGSSGEYYAQVISVHPGCSPVETPAVKIISVAVPDAAFTPSSSPGCVGQEITFTDQSTVDPKATATYTWSFGDNVSSSELSPKHIYGSAANYQVKLRISYQADACANEEIKSLSILNAPPVSITNFLNKFSLCPNDTVRLEVSGDTFSSYLWSTGAVTPFIIVNETQTYSVSVTNPAGCIMQASKIVSATEASVITVSAEPQQIKVNQKSQLSATGLESYLWRPGIGLSDSTIANPVATPLQNITYTVSGIDINGCRSEASIDIIVTGNTALQLITPKAFFSPNDDTINPFWEVEDIENFPQCSVVIYNDKGAKIFEAKPYSNNWDGTFKGNKLPAGVYYYLIRCDGETEVKTGSITLLK